MRKRVKTISSVAVGALLLLVSSSVSLGENLEKAQRKNLKHRLKRSSRKPSLSRNPANSPKRELNTPSRRQ